MDYALARPGNLPNSRTIFLLGGTYSQSADIAVNGSATAPVTWMSYPGEIAVIDGTLTISGDYVYVRDVVVTDSGADRTVARSGAIDVTGTGSKAINCVTHNGGGISSFSSGGAGSEVCGCITLFQGYEVDETDRGHEHGVYNSNATGVAKQHRHNIHGPGYGWGIHCYSATQAMEDFEWEANVCAYSGLLSGETASGGFPDVRYGSIIGGGGNVARHVITRHYGHEDTWDVSYHTSPVDDLTLSGVIRGIAGESDWTNLTDTSTHPATDAVYVEANPYEVGRANIVAYNSALANSVSVDLSSVLDVGDSYGIFDPWQQEADGTPKVLSTGTYAGGSVSITMPTTWATPVGGWRWGAAPTRSKAFGAFIVRKVQTWVAPAAADRIAA